MLKATNKYKYCNHHHELSTTQKLVNFGTGEFIIDKPLVPLIKALNEVGLMTRTHNYDEERCFISLVFRNNLQVEIRQVSEVHSTRSEFDNDVEILLSWQPKTNN